MDRTFAKPARTATSRRDRTATLTAALIIGLISCFALGLRLWQIDWSGPYNYHRDEPVKIQLINSVAHGSRELNYFRHPHFLLVSSAICLRVSEIFFGPLDQHGQTLVARDWTAVLAAGTVLLTGLLGLGWRGPMVGIAAALFLCVAPLHVCLSRYVKEDVALAFWLILAFGAAKMLGKTSRKRLWFFFAGAACGGALATKWVGIVAFIPVIYELRRCLRDETGLESRARLLILLFAIGAGSGWFLWHPWIFNNVGPLGRDITRSLVQGGWHGHRGIAAFGFRYLFTWHLWHSLLPGMGVSILVPALIGLVIALRRRYGNDGILIAFFFLAVYLPTEFSPLKSTLNSDRYVVGALPFLALLAAAAVSQLSILLSRRLRLDSLAISALVVVLLATPPFASAFAFSKNIAPDNRTKAREWMLRQLPRTTRIGFVGFSEYLPQQLEAGALKSVSVESAIRAFEPTAAQRILQQNDYFVLSSFELRLVKLWPNQNKKRSAFFQWLFRQYPVVTVFSSKPLTPFWPGSFSEPIEYGFNQPTLWIFRTSAQVATNPKAPSGQRTAGSTSRARCLPAGFESPLRYQ